MGKESADITYLGITEAIKEKAYQSEEYIGSIVDAFSYLIDKLEKLEDLGKYIAKSCANLIFVSTIDKTKLDKIKSPKEFITDLKKNGPQLDDVFKPEIAQFLLDSLNSRIYL